MSLLLWSFLLMFFALGLFVLELFIPSGGILGILSIASLLSSVSLAYYQSTFTGTLFLLFSVVAVPSMIASAIRWWPYTPIGRRIIIHPPKEDEILPDTEETRLLKNLIGKIGKARSPMLPSGIVTIEERNFDAVSKRVPIEVGQKVQVIQVEGNHVVVQLVEESDDSNDPDDILSQPIDQLGLDSLEEPLA